MPTVDALLDEGFALDVEAYWGAGFLPGRYIPGAVSWTWPGVVTPYLSASSALLDLGVRAGRGGEPPILGGGP